MKKSQKANKLTRSHCNSCGRSTKHHILAHRHIPGSEATEDFGEIHWIDDYELLECAGCETVTMRHTDWFEPTDETRVRTYPPPVARREPTWLRNAPTPRKIRTLMQQVYAALDSNSRALALMGARAVADIVLVEKVGDTGGFSEKLKAAEIAGVIGSKNRNVLAAALDAGNAAAHRGYQATADDVNAVMDIIENLLQAVYHLESLADRLKGTTPARSKAKP
jgi:hypothetical protein